MDKTTFYIGLAAAIAVTVAFAVLSIWVPDFKEVAIISGTSAVSLAVGIKLPQPTDKKAE